MRACDGRARVSRALARLFIHRHSSLRASLARALHVGQLHENAQICTNRVQPPRGRAPRRRQLADARGRGPRTTPRVLAAARPDLTRSLIRSRSNSARPAMIVRISLPLEVLRSKLKPFWARTLTRHEWRSSRVLTRSRYNTLGMKYGS